MKQRKNNSISLKEAVARAIAFFDLFDYPLTCFEVWQSLDVECDLAQVVEFLSGAENPDCFWQEKNGFYFLAGRQDIVRTRLERYNFANRKFKRALFTAKLFKIVPWIKMIAIGNLIGAHNLRQESDIDFFVVTEKKRIWITRFFCVLIIKLLGFRPKPGNARDKVCLSFFVSEQMIDLENFMLKEREVSGPEPGHDVYFVYWLAGLVPIYDQKDFYKKFIKENSWLKKYLPNHQPAKICQRRKAGRGFSWFYRDVVDMFLGGLDSAVKKTQLKILPVEIKRRMNFDNRVVLNDRILKMHINDRRAEYRNRLQIKLYEIFEKNN